MEEYNMLSCVCHMPGSLGSMSIVLVRQAGRQ